MSLRYLLDTNVISEPLAARPSESGLAWLEDHVDACAISSVTWHELAFGAARMPRGRRRDRIHGFLVDVVQTTYPVLPYGEPEASWHATERARLTTAGKTPAFVDGQIAAIAHIAGLTVVTANVRDFAPFRGLKVMAWPAP